MASQEIDDPRFLWIRDHVYTALDIEGDEIFEEFLQRSEGINESQIAKFLNQTAVELEESAIFYKKQNNEDVEESIEVCTYCLCCLGFCLDFITNFEYSGTNDGRGGCCSGSC